MTPDRSDFIAWAFDELFGAKKSAPDLERAAIYLAAAKGAPPGHEFYGNQWTSGGYVSTGGGYRARVDQINERQLESWSDNYDPDDEAQKTAIEVANSAADWGGDDARGVYDKNGKMQAVYHGEVVDQEEAAALGFDTEASRPYVLGELAVNPDNLKPDGERGWGIKAIYEAANNAMKQKADAFFLHSASEQSNRFYEKLGMSNYGGNTYGWDGADMRYFVRQWDRYGQAD